MRNPALTVLPCLALVTLLASCGGSASCSDNAIQTAQSGQSNCSREAHALQAVPVVGAAVAEVHCAPF
jgi:hypothetical protein